ncbi:MAG: hypothetical protein E5X59_32385, partial [Mesorhizobium sp.]
MLNGYRFEQSSNDDHRRIYAPSHEGTFAQSHGAETRILPLAGVTKACSREQPLDEARLLRRPASFARAASLEGSQMPHRRFSRTRLSPHDLAICERVYDQACAAEHIDPLSQDAEALAVMIVAI